jgi:outer membrane protein OmpA-like peptidoglycan-associated protein
LKTLSTIFFCILCLCANAQQTDTIIVHFEFNRSEITPLTAARLDSILQVIQARKPRQVKLYGHCDFKGSTTYNDSLSQARILSVKEYLGGKGIASAIFKNETAYGERMPLAEGNSDEARAINRRVEMVIESAAEPGSAITPVTPRRPAAEKQDLSQLLKDTALKTGVNLVLENLNFEGGRHQLLPESLGVLDELLRALQENPTVTIEIQGYVCCTVGSLDGYDWDLGTNDLSVQRAKAIYNFLIEKGINADRLSYRGYGGSRKLFPYEENEYQRSRNRRVELKIISK